VAKVFSVHDFKEGLDVRKSALTAPGGSLRILDNALITQGGEVAKRQAFVFMTTLPAEASYIFGQGNTLHIFGVGLTAGSVGSLIVPVVWHNLPYPAGATGAVVVYDVEAFDNGFYVTGRDTVGQSFIWWNNVIVLEVGGGQSRGTYARTYKTKMYRTDGRYLRFSGVNAPSQNDPANATNPGAGFINLAIHDPDGENLVAMEVFYDQVAIFARLMTQLWVLDPDPTKDALRQVIRVGTMAEHSVAQFGTGDILFFSDSGVRSLRSQTVTITAAVSDVGSAIDPILTTLIRTNLNDCINAQAVVQPIAGRYWLSVGDKIFVLSFFPAGKITAWSRFLPGFVVEEFATVLNQIYCRDANNNVWLYGGNDGITFDSSRVTVRTPHHDIENPTQRKRIQSVDVMCQGQWKLRMGMLPNNTDAFEDVATVQDNTFGLQTIPFAGYGTHVGLELVHEAPGPALLAGVHLRIDEGSTK
jgi:hypothetical protein